MVNSIGIKNVTEKIPAVIFKDRCPCCGNKLQLISINHTTRPELNAYYGCKVCNTIFPIERDTNGENPRPLMNNSIKDFLDNFGPGPYDDIIKI